MLIYTISVIHVSEPGKPVDVTSSVFMKQKILPSSLRVEVVASYYNNTGEFHRRVESSHDRACEDISGPTVHLQQFWNDYWCEIVNPECE